MKRTFSVHVGAQSVGTTTGTSVLGRDIAVYAIPRVAVKTDHHPMRHYDCILGDIYREENGVIVLRWLRRLGMVRLRYLMREILLHDTLEMASRFGNTRLIRELAQCGYTLEVIRAEKGHALALARNAQVVRLLRDLFGATAKDFAYGIRESQRRSADHHLADAKQITLLTARVFGLNVVWHYMRKLVDLRPYRD